MSCSNIDVVVKILAEAVLRIISEKSLDFELKESDNCKKNETRSKKRVDKHNQRDH